MVVLRPVFWVSSSPQLARGGGDPDLESGGGLRAVRVGGELRALRPGRGALNGVLDQGDPAGSRPGRAAGEQFSEIVGLGDAGAEVVRVPGAGGPGEQTGMAAGLAERVGGEAPQDRGDARGG